MAKKITKWEPEDFELEMIYINDGSRCSFGIKNYKNYEKYLTICKKDSKINYVIDY